MNNQNANTATPANQPASAPFDGTAIGSKTFDQIGSKTFDEVGSFTFDTPYPAITNQSLHVAAPANQVAH